MTANTQPHEQLDDNSFGTLAGPVLVETKPSATSNRTNGKPQDRLIPHTASPIGVNELLVDLPISFTVGEGDEVEGKITLGEGKCVVIRGVVRGDVHCKGLVILMTGGKVLGNVVAGQAWIEGEVGGGDNPSSIDAGTLHIGIGARVTADCTYDQISIATPNRGVKGRLESRASVDANA